MTQLATKANEYSKDDKTDESYAADKCNDNGPLVDGSRDVGG